MATTYDKASLVMIPSGVKESKLYSIKPTSGDGDFTFSRGTDTATRVNSSGLIEKVRSNQILHSNDFSNAAWSKIQSGGTTPVVTSGFTDPNGGSNAWRLECSITGGAYSMIQQAASSLTDIGIASIYIKSNTGSDQDVYFRIDNNDASTSRTATTSWQRIDVFTTASAKTISLGVRNNATGSTSSCDVLIYAAQVESGLVATDYIETTTAAVYEGITDNLPRLDYSGGASCPSLLLEPSRTNAFNHSEYSAAIEYNNVNSITNNAAISPEGVQNALEIDANANDITDSYRNVGSGVVATFSVFAKAGTGDSIRMAHTATGSSAYADFNLTSGTRITTGGAQYIDSDIEDYGNGWYRCWVTFTSGTGGYINRLTLQDTGTYNFYGFQLEAGSYATSYIPTYGTSASRVGDVSSITSATDIIGQTEGSIFMEVDMQNLDKAGQIFMELYQDANNRFGIAPYWDSFASQNKMQLYQFFGGALQVNIQEPITSGVIKVAVAYKDNDYVLYLNGVQVGTDTSASVPSTSTIYLGSNGSSFFLGNGVKQALLFKTRLTNAELASLTTI